MPHRRGFLLSGVAAAAFAASPLAAMSPAQRLVILGGSKSLAQQMPRGLLGLWTADSLISTPKPYLPNQAISAAPTANLLNAPRRMFAQGNAWGHTNVTVVDEAGTGPDGNSWAASCATTTGGTAWSLGHTVVLPAGTYTAAIDIKSNSGSSQTLQQGAPNPTLLETITVTTSWQSFAFTFTVGAGSCQIDFVGSFSGTVVNGNLLVDNARLYAGSVDLGASPLLSHAYLGKNAYDTSASISGGVLTPGSYGGIIQFPQAQSISAFTIISISSLARNSSGTAVSLSTVQNGGTFGVNDLLHYINNGGTSNPQYNIAFNSKGLTPSNAGGSDLTGNGVLLSALSKFEGDGFFCFGAVCTLTTAQYWLNDSQLLSCGLSSVTARSITDLWLDATSFQTTQTASDANLAAVAIWPRALSRSEYLSAYSLLKARVAQKSAISLTTPRIVVYEGDSIMNGNLGSGTAFAKTSAGNLSPIAYGYNAAVDGSQLSDMANRASAGLNNIPSASRTGKSILVYQIGHNDQYTGGLSTTTFLANLATYYSNAKAAGWTSVVAISVLPTTYNVAMEQWRQTVNAAIAAGIGTYCDSFVNWDSIIGSVGVWFNATISGTTLSITSSISGAGTIADGMVLVQSTGASFPSAFLTISSGSGNTWTLSGSATVSSPTAMALLPAWVLTDLIDGIHPNSTGNPVLEPPITSAINAI